MLYIIIALPVQMTKYSGSQMLFFNLSLLLLSLAGNAAGEGNQNCILHTCLLILHLKRFTVDLFIVCNFQFIRILT